MVQELLPFIPQAISDEVAAACVVAMCTGTFLWLCGAAWSRGIVTLLAVALGATLGMLLPRWHHWPVNSMAICVLGAVFFGLIAFILPRFGVGVTLGVVLSLWMTLAAWMNCRGDQGWTWQSAEVVQTMNTEEHAKDMWARTPETVRRVLPYAAGTAVVSALAISILFPRIGRVLCFSTMGLTLLFASSLTLVASRRPDWLSFVPPGSDEQAGILVIVALFGMMLQWQLLPRRKKTKPEDENQEERMLPSEPLVSTPGNRKFA